MDAARPARPPPTMQIFMDFLKEWTAMMGTKAESSHRFGKIAKGWAQFASK
jgi:hypothetical protein